jgi:hypothetical protein
LTIDFKEIRAGHASPAGLEELPPKMKVLKNITISFIISPMTKHIREKWRFYEKIV